VQELTAQLKIIDPDYQPWMTAISYEAEAKKVSSRKSFPWKKR
jgi:hypothetical protein